MLQLMRYFLLLAFFMSPTFAQVKYLQPTNPKGKAVRIPVQVAPAKANAARIDPALRHVLSVVDRHQSLNKTPQATRKALAAITYLDIREQQLLIPVLIKATNLQSVIERVHAAGGYTGAEAGDIIVAHIPPSLADQLAAQPYVNFIELSKISYPKLNVSHQEIGAHFVHSGTGLSQAYLGNGVVVGVLDSGIDHQHDDFKDDFGNIRIRYLWDMSGTSNPPAGYTYGTEWTQAQMQSGASTEIDGDGGGGHGTHVAGTAAGSGQAVFGYPGIAPESDIIFVKGIRDHNSSGGFSDADIVNGVAYIFDKAAQTAQPAVVNLSLGGHFGAHDGTSLQEQALNSLTGSGKIIVAAAGNEGGSIIHASYAAAPGASFNDALETIWIADGSNSVTLADMWYSGSGVSVGLAAYDQFGTLIGWTNPVAPGGLVENLNFDVGTGSLGLVSIDAQTTNDPNNGASRVLIVIDSQNGVLPISSVFWSLYTFGSGNIDAWVVTGGSFTLDSGGFYRPGDNLKTIGIPGTAGQIITVGSYVTKNTWIDINGIQQFQGGNPIIGNISSFSSIGPTRDGRLKPEITAPGEAILAAMSGNLTIGVGVQTSNIHVSGFLQKQQGTSMASPHIAGLVGLMLQRDPTLDVNGVRDILTSTARAVGLPNTTYGYGKVDALAAMQSVPTSIGDRPNNVPAVYRLEQNYPNPFNPATRITYNLPRESNVDLSVFNVLGQEVDVLVRKRQPAGKYNVDFTAEGLPSGIYYYQLQTKDYREARKMILIK